MGLNADSHGCINSNIRPSIDARLVKIIMISTKEAVLSVPTMPKDCLESRVEIWWFRSWRGGTTDMDCEH